MPKDDDSPLERYPELVAKLVGAICGGHDQKARERYANLYMREHENAERARENESS